MSHGPGQRILHVGQDVGIQTEGDGDAGMGRRILLRHTGLSMGLWAVIAGVSGFDD